MPWGGTGGGPGSSVGGAAGDNGNQSGGNAFNHTDVNMASGNPSSANYGGDSMGGNRGGSTSNGGADNMGGALSTGTPSAATASVSAAADTDSKKSGGIMGGLMSSVQAARAPSSTPGSVAGFAGTTAGKALSAASTPGRYGNDTTGSVSNSVGAMNTTEAQKKAGEMGVAQRQGFRDESNAGVTSGAFGLTGSMPASLAGKAIGAAMTANPYGDDEDQAGAYSSGKALAKQEGIGPAARTGAGLLGSVLGGPIGGMLADALTSAASYGLQRNYSPSAFDSSVTPGNPHGATGYAPSNHEAATNNGGNGVVIPPGVSVDTTPAPASKFEGAGNFNRGSYQMLNLLDILR